MKIRYQVARFLGHQQWLRLGLRRRMVRAIAPLDRLAPAKFDSRHFAGRYRGDIANAQEWHVYFFGGYELKELSLITDLLSTMSAPVALDIGGNLGGHALTISQVAASVHSVEPFPPLADRIESLMALNGKDNVTVHRVGLGTEDEELDYYLDTESRNQGTGSFLKDHSEGGIAAKLKVVRGDRYFDGVLDQLDFIKIDIEGFEAPALSGLKQTLEAYSPIVMMEVTQSSSNMFDEFGGLKAVFPFDFDLWKVSNPHYPLKVFQKAKYKLNPIYSLDAKEASYNVLIVPHSRRVALQRIQQD